MITKEFIGKYLWIAFFLYLLIGSLVVRFDVIDFIYLIIFISFMVYGYIADKKALDKE